MLLILILVSTWLFAGNAVRRWSGNPPTVQANNLKFIGTTINGTTASWKNGDGAYRAVFIAQTANGVPATTDNTTYTANSKFGFGTQISSGGWYCVYNGADTTVTITNLSPGSTYRVIVIEYNGTTGNEAYLQTSGSSPGNVNTLSDTPSLQALHLSFTNTTATGTTASWANGNGTSRAVFMALTSFGTPVTTNGTTYRASSQFGDGAQAGTTGWYCIYNGYGSTVNITGLTTNSTYRVMVIEYDGVTGAQKYLTTSGGSPANITTLLVAPAIHAKFLTFSNITPYTTQASWTNGNGAYRAVFISQTTFGTPFPADGTNYTANANFGSGTQISNSGWYCVYNGTGNSTTIKGLQSDIIYRVMVVEYNGGSSTEKYLTSAGSDPVNVTTVLAPPTVQSIHLVFSNITSNSTSVNWTSGNGTLRTVFIAQTTNGVPTITDGTDYLANSKFGSGSQIGKSGWFCVYNGSGTNAGITGLQSNITYRVIVVEYAGTTGTEKYLTTTGSSPNNVTTLLAPPTVQAIHLLFTNTTTQSTNVSWTNGNGTSRAVFIAKTANGIPATTDNTTYRADTLFGAGSSANTAGWYCIYNGTGSTAYIAGLAPGTTYRIMVIEYNGTQGIEKYLTTTGGDPANVNTFSLTPTTQATKLNFTNITYTSATISWANGNGMARAVFMADTTIGVPAPINNTTYTASAVFGNGTQSTAGWYCIYNGTGSSVNVSGLAANNTYRVIVVEYNVTAGYVRYESATGSSPANVSTLRDVPDIQATHLLFIGITSSAATVSWTSGNGTSRAVFVARTDMGVPSPLVNGTIYKANINFSKGTQIGSSGWYCVYNGSGSSAGIINLESDVTYRVIVVEYDSVNGYQKYLTTAGSSPANFTTLLIQTIHLKFTNNTTNSVTLNWTSGNGTGRTVFASRINRGYPTPADNTTYIPNENFGSGTEIGTGGWYCIYDGSGSSTHITNLLPGTIYRFIVLEYSGSAGQQQYLSPVGSSPTNDTTLQVVPTTQATHLTFSNITYTTTTASWANGNGALRAVFLARTNYGVPATANSTTYKASSTFSFGDQSSAGWYCVYNGTGSSVNISGLVGGTTYRISVIEYDGTAGNEMYEPTAGSDPANVTTTGALNSLSVTIPDQFSVNPDNREKPAIVANNILSPNGDGVNDTWTVMNIELYQNNKVTVFSSAGNIVFSRINYENDWAGTYQGSILSQGTYYYTIDLGNSSIVKGFITVVRDR